MIYWHDGQFGEDRISLEVSSPAFRFGTGIFETIFHNGSQACHLDLHLKRLHQSLTDLDIPHSPLTQAKATKIIDQVVCKNIALGSPARVNIYFFLANEKARPLIAAWPHTPNPTRTLRLTPCPKHHLSMLCAHKSMNYMFFSWAAQKAQKAGFDDALLLDLEGNVLETTTAALLFSKGDKLFCPSTNHKLPSTALQVASMVLEIEKRSIALDSLNEFDHAYALNSIMGMRPIIAVGKTRFEPDETTCCKATDAIVCKI